MENMANPASFARRIPGLRRVPIMWVLTVAEAAVATRRHWSGIDPSTRRRLRELVTKSRGRPSNLTAGEKRELRSLVGRLELTKLGRELAAVANPIRGPGRRRRRQS
jgi:hypothetical protein